MGSLLSTPSEHLNNWLIATSDICGDMSFQFGEPENCFGNIRRESIGELEVAHIECNVDAIKREKGKSDWGHDRHCFLILQRAGHMQLVDGNNCHRVDAGEIALIDSSQMFEMIPGGPISHLSIHLDRDEMFNRFPREKTCFGKVSLTSTCGRLLKTLIQQISVGGLPESASRMDGAALQSALIELSRQSLGGGPIVESPVAYSVAVKHALKVRAEELINQMLQDKELSPQVIAAALKISVRQLYRVFQDEDDGLHRYIVEARLKRCAEELVAKGVNKTITEICFRWGFSDSAHFSRVFKQQYGVSPRDYRLDISQPSCVAGA